MATRCKTSEVHERGTQNKNIFLHIYLLKHGNFIAARLSTTHQLPKRF